MTNNEITKVIDKDKIRHTIIERESSHLKQWRKLLCNGFMLFSLFVISLIKGNEDIAGIIKCSHVDWVLFSLLIVIALILTILGILVIKKEREYKDEIMFPYYDGELEFLPKVIAKLIVIGFVTGFLAGSQGLSIGMILSSVFLQMNLIPKVASATSMYMALYTTLSSTIIVSIAGKLNFTYAAGVVLVTILGTLPGLYLQNWFINKTGRSSIQILLLGFSIVYIMVFTPIMSFTNVIAQKKAGYDIMDVKPYC